MRELVFEVLKNRVQRVASHRLIREIKIGTSSESSHRLETARQAADILPTEIPDIQRIILFGSVARGKANWHSDIDLCVTTRGIFLDDPRITRISVELSQTLNRYGDNNGFRDKFHISVVPEELFQKPHEGDTENDRILRDIKRDGLELYRYPEEN